MTSYESTDPSISRSADPGEGYTPVQKPDRHYEEVDAAVPVNMGYLIPTNEYEDAP